MPEVTGDELDTGKCHGFFDIAVSTVFPAKGDVVFANVQHTTIANCCFCDIGTEVFDGGFSGTNGADVDTPVLAPDDGIDRPVELLELFAEGLFEGVAEGGDMDEKVGGLGKMEFAEFVKCGTRNDAVDVGVKKELLIPCVKHGDEARSASSEAFPRCQACG